jgi:hypothetical protein
MLKFSISIIGLILSTTSFAAEFKVVSEQKYYSQDGVQKFDGTYSYSQYSLKSKDDSSYKFLIKEKILSSTGKVLVDVSHDGGDLSAKEVQALGSIYSLCSVFNGQIESLTIKAGTFQTCKRTMGEFIEWYTEGFPFAVKRTHQDVDGLAVLEAIEVKIGEIHCQKTGPITQFKQQPSQY